MGVRFIDDPRDVSRDKYEQAVEEVVDRLRREEGVISIYQIGSVSTPGISDIDMVVVCEDEVGCTLDPLRNTDSYLFIHRIYGASKSQFQRAQDYSFFHNYRLLWGEKFPIGVGSLGDGQEHLLKAQIALEYLARMYVNMVLQRVYRVYRIRDFFLHVKAVRYDLEFLKVTSGRLWDVTNQLIDWRSDWFKHPPSREKLAAAINTFFNELVVFLENAIAEHSFYLPERDSYQVARSIWLQSGKEIGYRRRGMVLPGVLSVIGRKYFKLQNRLNHFVFMFPFTMQNTPEVLADRFQFLTAMKQYNERYLPHFGALASSLDV